MGAASFSDIFQAVDVMTSDSGRVKKKGVPSALVLLKGSKAE